MRVRCRGHRSTIRQLSALLPADIASNQGLTQAHPQRISAEYPMTYVIGSGTRVRLLARIGDYFFNLLFRITAGARPGTWCRTTGRIRVRPRERDVYVSFRQPAPVANTLNRYQDRHFPAIPAVAVMAMPLICANWPGNHRRRNSRRGRDSVCEQCHLSGEARVRSREWRFPRRAGWKKSSPSMSGGGRWSSIRYHPCRTARLELFSLRRRECGAGPV
jgi:hypothetical protein